MAFGSRYGVSTFDSSSYSPSSYVVASGGNQSIPPLTSPLFNSNNEVVHAISTNVDSQITKPKKPRKATNRKAKSIEEPVLEGISDQIRSLLSQIKDGEKVGFVYFIKEIPLAVLGNWIWPISYIEGGEKKFEDPFVCKIGFTGNIPRDRMADLQTGNPRELKLIAYAESAKYASIERLLHKDLKSANNTRKIIPIHGEFYLLTMEAIGELSDELGGGIQFIE